MIRCFCSGIGKEISDLSSDEEQTLMSNSEASTIKDINTGVENSFMQLSTEMRSKSSLSSTEQIPLKQRPSTAPASSNSSVKKEAQYAAITKSQMEALPLNVGIEEVRDYFRRGQSKHFAKIGLCRSSSLMDLDGSSFFPVRYYKQGMGVILISVNLKGKNYM